MTSSATSSVSTYNITPPKIAIIGAGPAGLMAAEQAVRQGVEVHVFDAMPSVGRKFLMAGKGGMNITHAEEFAHFVQRYGTARSVLEPLLQRFGARELRAWIHELGIETFVGSSGRVFPTEMKAAPLLRKWLLRLREQGVHIHCRHRWQGWQGEQEARNESQPDFRTLHFHTPEGEKVVTANAVILALGGGSWRKLGSDGAWVAWLAAQGIAVAPLVASNCGFDLVWSDIFKAKYAGEPLKNIWSTTDPAGEWRAGEAMITATGIEGGSIYAQAAALRQAIQADGYATLYLDLAPQKTVAQLTQALSQARGRDSWANHLRRRAGIEGVKAGLLREVFGANLPEAAADLASAIKALPLKLLALRPIDEAISTAGGVRFAALDAQLMLKNCPGVFCAGEMLDWDAPTGGYLLTACFATGHYVGEHAAAWAQRTPIT